MIYSIENKYLKVSAKTNGSCMTSIYDKKRNEELLYQVDERSWQSQDVCIFPIISALNGKSYTVDGKSYELKSHGIIRYVESKLCNKEEDSMTFNYRYNEETLKVYPFKFDYYITYKLDDNKLTIEYKVLNLDDKTIYFALGGHPALKVNGYENNEGFIYDNLVLEFEDELNVTMYPLDEVGKFVDKKCDFVIPKRWNMTKDIIKEAKTLVFDASLMNSVNLISGDKNFKFDLKNAKTLGIWTKPEFGDYICIEPWWGIPDSKDNIIELKNKNYINSLDVNDVFNTSYSITFNYK